MTDMQCDDRNRLLMQFHITGRCNLRCRHCYREEGDVEMLSLGDIKNVIDQFLQLRAEYNALHRIRKRAHINITGGEPFIRSDIKEILRYIAGHREELSFGILSNGSFIDGEMPDVLRQTGVSFVQLSIDGDRATHDALRAPGDYDRVLAAAQRLESSGIRTYISFTANRNNYRFLPEIAGECRRRGITKLWSDRLVPIGGGEEMKDLVITERELPDYLRALKKAQGSFLTKRLHPATEVAMNRALQFLGCGGSVYSCSAGDSLITVDEFGRVMPCRRMPVYCGDVFASTLRDIYFGSEVFRGLRSRGLPAECEGCRYSYVCRGGAKCQSHAAYGSSSRADPACPMRNKKA